MIKVIARSVSKEDELEKVLELGKELVAATVKEDGCIKYEIFQDVENPRALIVVEEWESMEALNNHMASDHFKRILPEMNKSMSQEFELNICKKAF